MAFLLIEASVVPAVLVEKLLRDIAKSTAWGRRGLAGTGADLAG